MCQYMYHLGKNSNNSGKPNPNTQAAELVHDFTFPTLCRMDSIGFFVRDM